MNRLFWIVMALIAGAIIILMVRNDAGNVFGISDDSFGRMTYLGIWGLVLAAGIFGSRMRLGNAARSLAIWVFIALTLVAGYQYRYELQDFASRVTAGLVPGSPISVALSDGNAAVVLDKLANGHFGARVNVDGTTVPMLVDTGASVSVLTASDARRAGFDTSGLAYDVPVMTANGTAEAARVIARNISIGGISRSHVPILVAEAGRLDQSLLGMDFIATLHGFQIQGDRMVLTD